VPVVGGGSAAGGAVRSGAGATGAPEGSIATGPAGGCVAPGAGATGGRIPPGPPRPAAMLDGI
jgi:hypothetical protein